MTAPFWTLIIVLAIAAFSIRAIGLFTGNRIRSSRHAWMLEDVPGLIVVSLVAASLANQPAQTWVAAAIALGVALKTNHVTATMCIGVLAYAGLAVFLG